MHPCNKSNKLKECVSQSQVCSWAKWPMQWSPSQFTQHEVNSSIMTTPWRKCKSIARLPLSTSSQVSLAMQQYPSLLLDGERCCENKVLCPRNNTITQPGLAHRTGMIFGEGMHSVFLVKIMSTIFDFNDSRRLERERNYLYQMGEWQEKIRKGVRWWSEYYYYDY